MKRNLGKGLLFLLAALLVLALPVVTGLGEEPEDEYEYYLDDSANAIITKYLGDRSRVQIPRGLDGNPVVGIGPKAFSGNTYMTNLEIHDKITEIELGAFQGCVNLGDVRFGAGLSSIGISAFENTALYRVQLPASLADLYNRAFANCSYLRRVNLPRDLRPIGSEVFAGCPNLILEVYKGSPGHAYALENHIQHQVVPESIRLPATARVFKGSQVQLQASAEPPEANQEALWSSSDNNIATVDDKGMVTGVVPGTATITATAKLGSGVKGTCSVTVYPKPPAEFSYEHTGTGITITGYTGSAAEVTVPGEIEGKPVLFIDMNAFKEKTGITKVVLPDSILIIYNNAFSGCSSLASITLPQSLIIIEWNAFYECSSLTNLKIPDGVTEIGLRAFYDCSSLSAVGLPPGLTEIENSLFLGCTSLAGITIPDGVTSIGEYAFYLCKNLNRITIRAHVTSFGEKAFGGAPVTIFGDVPSAAKDYADANNIPFVDLAGGIPGDANNDLEVNAEDLISLTDYLVKDTPCPSMKNADANKDGKVNELDAVAIINMMVGD